MADPKFRARNLSPNDPNIPLLKKRKEEREVRLTRFKSESARLKEEGNNLFRKGDYHGSMHMYIDALKAIHKPDPVLLCNLAASFLKQEMYPEAEQTATEALARDPKSVKARYRRSMARKGMKRYRGAVIDLDTLLSHGHDSDDILNAFHDAEASWEAGDNTFSDDGYASSDYDYPSYEDDAAEEYEAYSGSSDCEHEGNGTACRFYNHGGCNRGNACRFSHAPDGKSVRDDLGKNVCIHFLLGTCKYGADKCIYSHNRAYLPERGWWNDPESVEVIRAAFEMNDRGLPSDLLFLDAFMGNPIPAEGEESLLRGPPSLRQNKNKKGRGKKKAVSASEAFVLIIVLEDDGFWHDIHSHLLKALRAKIAVKQSTSKNEARELLASSDLAGVLVVDAGIARRRNASLADELSEYAKRGGAVVIGGQFSNHITPADMKALMQRFGLPWTMGDYHRTTHTRNSQNDIVRLNPSLPKSYSMKAVHIAGAEPAAAMYGPTEGSKLQSMVFAPVKIDNLAEYPIVHARVGDGYLGFIGDVNGETESTPPVLAMLGLLDAPLPTAASSGAAHSSTAPQASTSSATAPAPPTKKTVVVFALDGMLEMFQSINAHFLSTLTPKAHITNITTPAHAKKTLDASAPAPDAILVVDAALSEKKHKNLLPLLKSYVRNGGTLLFAGCFSSFARFPDMDRMWPALGVPWAASSYHREDFAKELDHATVARNPSLPGRYSMKALQLKNVGSSGMYSEGKPESPIVHKRMGSGYLGYIGDVNGEEGTTPCILAMLGLLDVDLLH